jgi:type 1 fimbria pilin
VKKILFAAVALAALLLVPSVAQATTSVTVHVNGQPIDVGPAGCVPGDLVVSGNGVLHQTINNAGDTWVTGTVEGSVFAADPSSGFTGHAAAWFGVEQNNQNFVTHFIGDSVGTLGNGSPLRIHQEGQFTVNALGLPVVTRVTVTCS